MNNDKIKSSSFGSYFEDADEFMTREELYQEGMNLDNLDIFSDSFKIYNKNIKQCKVCIKQRDYKTGLKFAAAAKKEASGIYDYLLTVDGNLLETICGRLQYDILSSLVISASALIIIGPLIAAVYGLVKRIKGFIRLVKTNGFFDLDNFNLSTQFLLGVASSMNDTATNLEKACRMRIEESYKD